MTETRRDVGAWIRRFHPSDAPVRVVCFPHAGGAASYFHSMSRTLSAEMDVLAVQYPGRQERRGEPCVDDLSELADLVLDEIRPWADRPLAFFGHSMGALLGFEVARRLEREGVTPATLFVSGRCAPRLARHGDVHLRSDDELVAAVRKLNNGDLRLLDEPEARDLLLPPADLRLPDGPRSVTSCSPRCAATTRPWRPTGTSRGRPSAALSWC